MILKYILLALLILSGLFFVTSCEETLEAELKNEKIVLLSPIDSVQSTDTLQLFYWQHSQKYADYQLQVVSPRFDSMVKLIADTITTKNQLQLKLKKGFQYQWRVRAVNYSFASPYSSVWNLWVQ